MARFLDSATRKPGGTARKIFGVSGFPVIAAAKSVGGSRRRNDQDILGFRLLHDDDGLTGRCLCGAVRYQSGPAGWSTLCHCESCRRASGAHVLGLVTVAAKEFQWTAAAPGSYRSSPAVVRTFCSTCGTPLTYSHDSWPEEIALTIGSIDQADEVPPTDHTWTSEGLVWDGLYDQLRRYERDPP
jgi:hypothetical protein